MLESYNLVDIYLNNSAGENDVIVLNFDYTAENSKTVAALPVIFNTDTNKTKISEIKPIIFEDCPELNRPIIIYNAVGLLPQLKEILLISTEPSVYKDALQSAKLKSLIVDTLKKVTTDSVCDNINIKVQTVLDYIKINYQNELDNKTLASLVGYHPYYLNNIVKSTTGMSLHQHLINHRIINAEKMLLSTDASVSEIALKVGFSSTMILIRNFKLKNNVTPFEYRKQIRNMI